jgi:predicted dithiol-disulfide oxidoreductase (DUF899 family)
MVEHRIGTQQEWQVERDALLEQEKELTRRGDDPRPAATFTATSALRPPRRS